MLPRLGSSLPPATASFARSTALNVSRAPACIRFNSSEAAEPGEPKKRGVPLAQNLGGINIRTRNRANGQQRGERREGGNPRGQQLQQPRQPRADHQPGRAAAGPRSENRRPRDGQRQPRPPRTKASDAPEGEGAASAKAAERPPVAIPKPARIELGNLDELFGSPALPSTPHAVSAASRKDVTPSQARVQLLLEKTAGDYSRYVPRPFPVTDVRKLGPVKLGEFVLSRKRDAGLTARQNVLTVVAKFANGKGVRVS